jgi:hypothetical protein
MKKLVLSFAITKSLGLMTVVSTLALLSGVGGAAASTDTFTIIDPNFTETFTLPQPFTPGAVHPGIYFSTNEIPVVLNGLSSFDDIVFQNPDASCCDLSDGGGGRLEDAGLQLYSGPEGDPTFILGTFFPLYNYMDGQNDSITISSSAPLPAALPLFATGLGALGLLGWRRKRKVLALAAA